MSKKEERWSVDLLAGSVKKLKGREVEASCSLGEFPSRELAIEALRSLAASRRLKLSKDLEFIAQEVEFLDKVLMDIKEDKIVVV